MDDLYRPMFLPDLLIAALERNGDRPAVHIGGEMRTAAELRDEISRYVQAFRAQGIELGDGVATLSKNRVEVLYSMGAVMVTGCRNTPLHPLGSLDDHAYVLEDAGIETLLFDPSFADRARELRAARARAPTTAVVRRGRASATDLIGLAATFEPAAARRATGGRRRPVGARVHRWHDRQAEGRDEHLSGQRDHGPDHGVGAAVARRGAPPDLHAAEPRRFVVVRPAATAGRGDVRAADLRRRRGARGDRAASHHHHDAGPLDDLRAPRPPALRGDRPLQPADRLLRRVGHVAGPSPRGDREARPDLRAVLRPDRSADDRVRPAQGGPRRRQPRTARVVRPSGSVGSCRAARRRRQRGSRR